MQIDQRPIADLKPHPANYRRHPEHQLGVLRDSIRLHGLQKPVVIQSDGTILAGHGLVEAAKLEGLEQVPVHVYDGPYPDAFLAMDNRSALLAEDDDQALAELLKSLEGTGTLEASGYGDDELKEILGKLEAEGTGGNGDGGKRLGVLAERFGVPPFSVLDARQGYWQERKRAWIALGIQSELGRGGAERERERERERE